MKDLGLLFLGALSVYGGYRYAVYLDRIKAAFPEHAVGHSPTALIRGLGIVMLLVGAMLAAIFVKSLFG